MSGGFPGSPSALRGALVKLDVLSMQPVGILPFQFNPVSVARSFELKTGEQGVESGQLSGVPAETIKVEIELDAHDGRDPSIPSLGVSHQLAAFEGFVTPSAFDGLSQSLLAAAGTLEVLPPAAPLTLFVWGPRRVIPIVVKELSVTEEGHDADLVPTLAKVSLGMRVLNWGDVSLTHPAYGLSLAHQIQKEILSAFARVGGFDSILGTPELPL